MTHGIIGFVGISLFIRISFYHEIKPNLTFLSIPLLFFPIISFYPCLFSSALPLLLFFLCSNSLSKISCVLLIPFFIPASFIVLSLMKHARLTSSFDVSTSYRSYNLLLECIISLAAYLLTFMFVLKLSNRFLRLKREARFAFISAFSTNLSNSQKIFAYRETRLSHTLVIVCNMINGYYYLFINC